MFTATDISLFERFSIRVDPDLIDELQADYTAIQKAAYLSERHWVSINLDGSIPDKKLVDWIDLSYALAVAKLTKKVREQLNL